MKTKKLLTLLATGVLTMSLLVACSPKKETIEQPPESSSSEVTTSSNQSTSDTESSGFNAKEYLTIDTSKIANFKLSNLVQNAVGTYSGVVSNNWATTEYQVKINKDGTYLILSRGLFLREEDTLFPKADQRPYLDSHNALQHKQLEEMIDGKLYEFSDFKLERGVVIERYGQLYFASLSNHKIFPYLDQDGTLDLAKGLVVEANALGINDRVIDTASDYEKFLETNFAYSKTLSEPSEFFVIDSGKLTIDKVEVPKSSNVDPFLTTDLTTSFAKDKVLKQVENSNDVLQFARSKVPIDTYTITALKDFSDVYLSDGQQVHAEYAITLKDEKYTLTIYDETEIYTYYKGTIYYGKEVNGKFVLNEAL